MLTIFRKAITKITSNNFFAKLLFGVDCRKGSTRSQICFATILMKKALNKFVKDGDRILDIGTGSFAIHSIWLKKNKNVDVTATEIDDNIIKSAKIAMKDNKVKFKIEKRDLFKGLKENFDWAIVNPPFANRQDKSGYEFVERLLKETPKNLKLMIAVNSLYVNLDRIEAIIKNSNYKMIDIVRTSLMPSRVYIVQRAS